MCAELGKTVSMCRRATEARHTSHDQQPRWDRDNQVEWCDSDRTVYLGIVRVGNSPHEPMSGLQVFSDEHPKAAEDRAIEVLCLSIGLRIVRRCEQIPHAQSGPEELERLACELEAVA